MRHLKVSWTHPAGGRDSASLVAARALSLAAGLLLLAAPEASAVIGLSPLRVQVYARPGVPTPFNITVINTTDAPRDVRLIVANANVSDTGRLELKEETTITEGATDQAASDGQQAAASAPTAPQEPSTPTEPQEPSTTPEGKAYVTFDVGNQLPLAPGQSQELTGSVNLPPDAKGQYLAIVIADGGEEDMPLYGRSADRNIKIRFRIAASIFIMAGHRGQYQTAGGLVETFTPAEPPFFNVEIVTIEARQPKEGDVPHILRVTGTLDNRSNVFVTPIITASLIRTTGRRRVRIEQTVCSHGFNIVFAQTRRFFEGRFQSPIESGEYMIEVEVDYGEQRRARAFTRTFVVETPIKGVRPATQGVIQVQEGTQITVSVRPGDTSRGEVRVQNNFSEPLRVVPEFAEGSAVSSWLTIAPAQIILTPRQERPFRITIRVPRDAPVMAETVQLRLVPKTTAGTEFAPSETPVIVMTVRVLPPKGAAPSQSGSSGETGGRSGGGNVAGN
jgi:hypothetical protein